MKERAFDIFELIKGIEGRDIEFFDGLEEYQVKQISPVVLMKWMSYIKDGNQVININEFVNSFIFKLNKHPKLMYKILMSCATKKEKRVFWLKRPKKDNVSLTIKLIAEYYNCSTKHAKDYIKLIKKEDIIDMAESLAYPKELMTKLKKELNGN